jgi:hypothetical protein
MKKILLFTLIQLIPIIGFSQQAQIGEKGRTLLVWPFDESFYIDQNVGSHGWNMICGPGCGYHKNSDQYALDWSRAGLSACGSVFNAPLSGIVLFANLGTNAGYGNQVVIQSDQNPDYAFRLAHMQEVWVGAGDYLEAGEPIGRIGDTGNGGCHGHLAVYRNIYDRAETIWSSADTNRTYRRAIDYLTSGQFVPTPYENSAYFSEPFSFLREQEGIALELFGVEEYAAIEDSIEVVAKLRNVGNKEWTGALALGIQEEEVYRYYASFDFSGKTDTFTLAKGSSMEFRLTFPVGNMEPGLYFAHLLFVSEALSPDQLLPVALSSSLRSAQIQLISKEVCNQDEPNDEATMATALFSQPLSAAAQAQRRRGLISVFEDEKDVYTFQTRRTGRMKIIFTDSLRFSMSIYDSFGAVPLSGQAGTYSFITQPNTPYFIEMAGRPDCDRPYEFSYEWIPVERVEWQFWTTEKVNSVFIALEPVEVEWQIIDMVGRRLFSSGKKMLEPGAHFDSFSLDNFPPGIYLAALLVDGRMMEHRKFFWFK